MICSRNIFLQGLVAITFLIPLSVLHAENIDAKVKWSQRVEMSTFVSGIVVTVDVKVGQRVKKGDVLLRLDASRFNTALTRAKAVQRNAAYVLAEAEREKSRAQELYDRTVLSDYDLQQAENMHIAALANQAKAKAGLASAAKDLADSMIRAPFDAVIVLRQAEVGQTIATGLQVVPMLTLAASNEYLARGRLVISDLNALRTGQVVDVSTGGQRYQGKIEQLGMEPVDAEKGLYAVEVRFNAGKTLVRAGQHAILHLP